MKQDLSIKIEADQKVEQLVLMSYYPPVCYESVKRMRPFEDSLGASYSSGPKRVSKKISYFLSLSLSWLFRGLPIPEGFPAGDSRKFTLVTLDNSIVLDAILIAIAKRSGLKGLGHGGISLLQRQGTLLYRVPFRAESTLASLGAQDPNHSFVTFNVVYGLGPIKTTRNYSINIFDSLSLIFWRSSLSLLCGEPRTLQPSKSNISRAFSRALKVDFYHHLKVIRGTPFQPIRVQSESVLSGDDYQLECERLAKDQAVSVSEIKRDTEKAFFEMAANPVRWVHLLIGNLAKLVIWHLFPLINVTGLQNLINSSRQNPTVLVPVHRSHLDYILLGSILFKSRLNTPLVAAGINLNFWPVGFFLRRVGAFFVKRTGGSDPIHGLVLRRYVTYLLKRGHLLEFFIEGGRSRTGRMRPPKLGLLKAIVAAYQKGLRKDVAFIPVSISYEHVIEDKALARENKGDKKIEENVKSLFSARTILGKKYGEVIVNFHDPIFISKFGSAAEKGRGSLVNNLASELTHRMRSGTNPTLTSLSCTSIMLSPHYAQTENELKKTVSYLNELIKCQRTMGALIGDSSKTLDDFVCNPDLPILNTISSGLVESDICLGENVLRIPENKRLRADFYRNGTLHLFIHFAVMEMARDIDGSVNWKTVENLHQIFEDDFILEERGAFLAKCREMQPKLEALNAAYGMSGVLNALMLPSLELYLWVLNYLNKIRLNWTESSSPRLQFDSFTTELIASSEIALECGLVSRTETFSKAGIESTLDALTARGIISAPPARRGPRFLRIVSDPTDEIVFISSLIENIIAFNNRRAAAKRLSLVPKKS
jgi:1-acyl-sn-glycerol-3-phosphate acyltransferase